MRSVKLPSRPREENPVIFLEISTTSDTELRSSTLPGLVLGRLYFELRQDIVPLACHNFLQLVRGSISTNGDVGEVRNHLKGTSLHRIIKDRVCQGGDLKHSKGDFSRSIYYDPQRNKEGLFEDENFILRHTGPGCISYSNRGPNTNGSIFQITMGIIPDFDEKFVVFGCLVTKDSFACLKKINDFGTKSGLPSQELFISDCDQVYPKNS